LSLEAAAVEAEEAEDKKVAAAVAAATENLQAVLQVVMQQVL
jgi:hypothetical protein